MRPAGHHGLQFFRSSGARDFFEFFPRALGANQHDGVDRRAVVESRGAPSEDRTTLEIGGEFVETHAAA